MNRHISIFCGLALATAVIVAGCGAPQGSSSNTATVKASPTPTSAPVTTVNCASSDHMAILTAIYHALAATDYDQERWHFNISESNKKISIKGWSPNNTQITALVAGAAQGCQMDPNNAYTFPVDRDHYGGGLDLRVSCPTNYVPCGDVCIPTGEECRIRLPSLIVTPAVSGANSNADRKSAPTP